MEPVRPIFTVEAPRRGPGSGPGGPPPKVSGKTIAVTMLLSIGAYSLFYGLPFAILFVVLIFVHELGHVIAARCFGVPVSAPVFIPLVGAYVLLSRQHLTAWTDAMISWAGPLAGGLGGWVCLWAGNAFDSNLLITVAYFTFLLNAANLAPFPPLDGSHIWKAFTERGPAAMTTEQRTYLAIFVVALMAGLILGCIESHGHPLSPVR